MCTMRTIGHIHGELRQNSNIVVHTAEYKGSRDGNKAFPQTWICGKGGQMQQEAYWQT